MQASVPDRHLLMDRKYSIFLSSSFEDLREHRKRLVTQTLNIGHIPVGMEQFQAGVLPSTAVIEHAIDSCDVFVILVGARLGSDVREDFQSYVEWEFQYAQKQGKPTLAFLLEEDEYKRRRGQLPDGDPERRHDEKLASFRRTVQTTEGGTRIVAYFSYEDIASLALEYAGAVQATLAGKPPGGWIRYEHYNELAQRGLFSLQSSRNPFFRRFAERLNQFGKLSGRTRQRDTLKQAAARYLWDLLLPATAIHSVDRVFLESGSSIAYVSAELIERLQRTGWTQEVPRRLEIATNNILTYLDFILMKPQQVPVEVHRRPKGEVEMYYGAIFGGLTELTQLPPPERPRGLEPSAEKKVHEFRDMFREFLGKKGIILMAASGVELSHESPFPGIHVGSYYNKLVKRSLLETGCPVVVVLDEEKFPQTFLPGGCYSVCGPGFEWAEVMRQKPVAFIVATSSEPSRERVQGLLEEMSFRCRSREIESDEGHLLPVVFGSNEKFREVFPDNEFGSL